MFLYPDISALQKMNNSLACYSWSLYINREKKNQTRKRLWNIYLDFCNGTYAYNPTQAHPALISGTSACAFKRNINALILRYKTQIFHHDTNLSSKSIHSQIPQSKYFGQISLVMRHGTPEHHANKIWYICLFPLIWW